MKEITDDYQMERESMFTDWKPPYLKYTDSSQLSGFNTIFIKILERFFCIYQQNDFYNSSTKSEDLE